MVAVVSSLIGGTALDLKPNVAMAEQMRRVPKKMEKVERRKIQNPFAKRREKKKRCFFSCLITCGNHRIKCMNSGSAKSFFPSLSLFLFQASLRIQIRQLEQARLTDTCARRFRFSGVRARDGRGGRGGRGVHVHPLAYIASTDTTGGWESHWGPESWEAGRLKGGLKGPTGFHL